MLNLILYGSGTFGNTLTLVVLLKARSLYNNCTPYMFSLTWCDLMQTTLILPVMGINALNHSSFLPAALCQPIAALFHTILGESLGYRGL